MAEHVVICRQVDAAEWTDAHRELAASALFQGLPEPARASYVETTIETESLDGDLLDLSVIREAAIGNCGPRRPRLDHTALHCPGPGRCDAHHPR